MPKVRRGETENHYMTRCIPFLRNEGKPEQQAIAICNAMWSEKKAVTKSWSNFVYDVKGNELQGLDAPTIKDVVFDTSKMCATGILATTSKDRVGDVLEVNGIDFTNHKKNPIVLVDHGQWYMLPIGKTIDENGNYTVWLDGDDCFQTTYFSQNSQIAEQVYSLYCEGILKANSIGFRPIEVSNLKPDIKLNLPPARWIKKCELLECSWVGIPCNQDAVMATLSRDKICGKSICPEIKAMLSPYILPKHKWVSVPIKEIMNKNVPEGAVEAPADKPEEQDVPLGKSVLKGMSDDLKDVMEQYSQSVGPVEQEKVKSGILKHIEALKSMVQKMDELHEKVYNKKDVDEDEAREDTADAEDEEVETPEDVDYEKSWKLKALDAFKKILDSKEEKVDDSEKIKKLERAINRRLNMVSRLA